MIGMEKLRQLFAQAFVSLGLVAEQDGALEQVLLNLLWKLAPQVDSRQSHHDHKPLAILGHRCDLVPCVAVLAACVARRGLFLSTRCLVGWIASGCGSLRFPCFRFELLGELAKLSRGREVECVPRPISAALCQLAKIQVCPHHFIPGPCLVLNVRNPTSVPSTGQQCRGRPVT